MEQLHRPGDWVRSLHIQLKWLSFTHQNFIDSFTKIVLVMFCGKRENKIIMWKKSKFILIQKFRCGKFPKIKIWKKSCVENFQKNKCEKFLMWNNTDFILNFWTVEKYVEKIMYPVQHPQVFHCLQNLNSRLELLPIYMVSKVKLKI